MLEAATYGVYLQLSEISGGSLGYGFSQTIGKPKPRNEPTTSAKTDDNGKHWLILENQS